MYCILHKYRHVNKKLRDRAHYKTQQMYFATTEVWKSMQTLFRMKTLDW